MRGPIGMPLYCNLAAWPADSALVRLDPLPVALAISFDQPYRASGYPVAYPACGAVYALDRANDTLE